MMTYISENYNKQTIFKDGPQRICLYLYTIKINNLKKLATKHITSSEDINFSVMHAYVCERFLN